MSSFPRRQIQAFDLDAFDYDGEKDGASRIMEMFAKKNNRVLKIFEPNDKDDTVDAHHRNDSYQLLLTSRTSNDVAKVNKVYGNNSVNQKRINDVSPVQNSREETPLRKPSLHMRNLSPIDIVLLSSQELSDPIAKSPITRQMEPKKSLRRTLFSFLQPKISQKHDPICSTPMPSNQKGRRVSFFGDKNGKCISPILNEELTPEKLVKETPDLLKVVDNTTKEAEPIELPQPAANNYSTQISHIQSLAEIEKDLTRQYGNSEKSTCKKTKKVTSNLTNNQKSSQRTNDEMEIDNESISRYRKDVLRNLSFQNRTDRNSIRIIETPTCGNQLQNTQNLDNTLAIKLRRCDDSNVGTKSIDNELYVNQSSFKLKLSTTVSRSSELDKTSKFLVPATHNKNRSKLIPLAHQEELTADLDNSINRVVPSEILRSFRTLSSKNHAVNSEEIKTVESLKINIPKKPNRTNVKTSNQSYVNLTSKTKTLLSTGDSTIRRKRTLYSNEDVESTIEMLAPGELSATDLVSSSEDQLNKCNHVSKISVGKEKEMSRMENSNETHLVSLEEPVKSNKKNTSRQLKAPKINDKHIKVHKKIKPVSKNPVKKKRPNIEHENATESDSSDSSQNGTNHESSDEDKNFSSESTRQCKKNVKYNPYDQGCKRPGLRVRRFAKPYWVHNNDADLYGITYGVTTHKTYNNEQNLLKLGFIQKPKQPIKTKPAKTLNSSVTSKNLNLTSNDSVVSLIQSIREGNLKSVQSEPAVKCKSFDMSNIGNINFRECGGGLYFGPYIENKSDGIIKLIPGGYKPKGKSKNSLLKFFVLYGKVDIIVEGEKVKLTTFGYLSINPGHRYEVKNSSDQDVILYFTRYDKPLPDCI